MTMTMTMTMTTHNETHETIGWGPSGIRFVNYSGTPEDTSRLRSSLTSVWLQWAQENPESKEADWILTTLAAGDLSADETRKWARWVRKGWNR